MKREGKHIKVSIVLNYRFSFGFESMYPENTELGTNQVYEQETSEEIRRQQGRERRIKGWIMRQGKYEKGVGRESVIIISIAT